ncbi:MAG: MarR family winged helix-turn-helix transcriptional regulator [Halioglobus sp.]
MPSESLGEALHQLMHAYKHLLHEGIREQKIELPITHIRALKGICRNPQSTAQSIALRMQRDKAQITRALNDLIEAGMIAKADNPQDRRSQLLKPTSKGKKVMAKLEAAEDLAVQQLTRNLEAEDLAFFLRLSSTMANNVEPAPTAETGEH